MLPVAGVAVIGRPAIGANRTGLDDMIGPRNLDGLNLQLVGTVAEGELEIRLLVLQLHGAECQDLAGLGNGGDIGLEVSAGLGGGLRAVLAGIVVIGAAVVQAHLRAGRVRAPDLAGQLGAVAGDGADGELGDDFPIVDQGDLVIGAPGAGNGFRTDRDTPGRRIIVGNRGRQDNVVEAFLDKLLAGLLGNARAGGEKQGCRADGCQNIMRYDESLHKS